MSKIGQKISNWWKTSKLKKAYDSAREYGAAIAAPLHRSVMFLLNFVQCLGVISSILAPVAVAVIPWITGSFASLIPFAQVAVGLAVIISLIYAYRADKKAAQDEEAHQKIGEHDETLETLSEEQREQAERLDKLEELVSTQAPILNQSTQVGNGMRDKSTQVEEADFDLYTLSYIN